MRRVLVTFALLAPLLSACSDGAGDEEPWEPCQVTSTDIGHPTGSRDVVLSMGYGGGLPPPVYVPEEMPDILVYGDGRLLMIDQGGPAGYPFVHEAHLEESRVQEMLHEVERVCSLRRDWRLDAPVYDVGGFWIRTTTDHRVHLTWAVGLGFDEIADVIPANQARQRQALLALDTQIRSIADEAGFVTYEPEQLGVFFEPIEDGEPTGSSWRAWPLEEDLATFGTPHPQVTTVRCGTVEGEDIALVAAALRPDEAWNVPALQDDGVWYRVAIRPMLPGETDCLELIA